MAVGSLAPLRHRGFRLLWLGSLVSNVGTWMETVALGRYVADATGRATWSGLIAAAGFLPTAFVGLIGGALADRGSRRLLLVGSNLVMAVIAVVVTVLVAGDHAGPGVLTLLTLLAGCASAIGFPSFQAATPDLVPPEVLPAAIGLGSVQWNLGRVFGPAIAGIVIALAGIPAALAVNAASFLAVVVAVAMVAIPRGRSVDRRPLLSSVFDGVRIVRSEPGLRAMNTTMCLNTLIAAPFIGLIPAMVNQVVRGGKGVNAVFVTAQGIGAVIAGLTIGGLVARRGARRVMIGAVVGVGVSLIAYGLSPTPWPMAVALGVVGGTYMMSLSSFSTIAQMRSPAAMRGRVMSVSNAVLGLLYPVGLIMQGAIGDVIGMRHVTVAAGVVLLAVMGGRSLVRPEWYRPIDSLSATVSTEFNA